MTTNTIIALALVALFNTLKKWQKEHSAYPNYLYDTIVSSYVYTPCTLHIMHTARTSIWGDREHMTRPTKSTNTDPPTVITDGNILYLHDHLMCTAAMWYSNVTYCSISVSSMQGVQVVHRGL